MNKYDFILIIIVIIICSLIYIFIDKSNSNYAYVYYDNELIKKIDLKVDNEYDIDGYNGNVHIKVENNILKVTDEKSPYHLCQKSSLSKKNESIICLPNHIIIKTEQDLDTIIGA